MEGHGRDGGGGEARFGVGFGLVVASARGASAGICGGGEGAAAETTTVAATAGGGSATS